MTIDRLYILLRCAENMASRMDYMLDSTKKEDIKDLTLADVSDIRNVIRDLAEFIKGIELT